MAKIVFFSWDCMGRTERFCKLVSDFRLLVWKGFHCDWIIWFGKECKSFLNRRKLMKYLCNCMLPHNSVDIYHPGNLKHTFQHSAFCCWIGDLSSFLKEEDWCFESSGLFEYPGPWNSILMVVLWVIQIEWAMIALLEMRGIIWRAFLKLIGVGSSLRWRS